jgi:uncharacterized membrane protein
MDRFVPVVMGALLMFVRNVLPRLRSDFFLGIRTQWTLSSDTACARAHRVGGGSSGVVGLMPVASGRLSISLWSVATVVAVIAW